MSEIDSLQEHHINPNIQIGDRTARRYPNQFFDLSMQYMPPTIKELFRWCTFYYYNSPLLGAAIKKKSQYPITDLIFEHHIEGVRNYWETIFNDTLKIRSKLLEVNLDRGVYGNCFVSLQFPFTRMLRCSKCGNSAPIKQWQWTFRSHSFHGECAQCKTTGSLQVRDIVYKDVKKVEILRWSPENIEIKHNEYTGKTIYLYTPPKKLRYAVEHGDKDLMEDMPLIVIEAVKDNKKIRMNNDNFFHLKNPTLAEQDQGWGKPDIIHVLKDMFYFYTLRRAQEAIALEHIVPLDLIYPMPNAQMDPFIHSDLGSWKSKIEQVIQKHRRDPNYKAVIPIPVGFGRLGGDGKALLLGPEIQYLTQTIVGGMGIPSEFLFGGLSFSGSSVSLRTLENDFIQNRTQLLDLVIWIKNKLRVWLNAPDITGLRFADFRMADDVQRNQQLIGMNAQGKVSDQTMLTELGYNYEEEVKKRLEEIHIQSYMNDLITKGQARSQGEAQLIQHTFQKKLEDITTQAQISSESKINDIFKYDATGQIQNLVGKLLPLEKSKAQQILLLLRQQVPEIASAVEDAYVKVVEAREKQMHQIQLQQEQMQQQIQSAQMESYIGQASRGDDKDGRGQPGIQPPPVGGDPNVAAAVMSSMAPSMQPEPSQKPPRRQGGV